MLYATRRLQRRLVLGLVVLLAAGIALAVTMVNRAPGSASAANNPQDNAQSRPRLPTIHERFTLLSCPRDRGRRGSTLGMEGCFEHAIVRADRRVMRAERGIFADLRYHGRTAFAKAERSWLTFRRSYCDAQESSYVGGTVAPVIFGSCEAALTQSHAGSLARWLLELRRH